MIGKAVGNYTITRQLGRGGMGAVYLGEHSLIGRKAAIKVLLPELSHHEQLVARLFNEAKVTTAIRHPGIVDVFDFGYHHDGRAYLVMEYLEGVSLRDRLLERGRVDIATALDFADQICEALAAAHNAGVIHRDLKPDNLFIVADTTIPGRERLKVLDFGIAKLANDDSEGSYRTRTGAVLGTPAYMSPEQCRGAGEVDSRADLYSLGCILYHLLVGDPPFQAKGSGSVLAAHIYEDPPSVRDFDPSINASIERLVSSLLAKNPDKRPQTAGEVSEAIALIRSGEDISHHSPIAFVETDLQVTAAPPATGVEVTAPPRGETMSTVAESPAAKRVFSDEQTTLSSATSTRNIVTPPRGRKPWLYGAAGAVLVAGAAATAIVVSKSSPASAPQPDASVMATTAPDPDPPPPAVLDASAKPEPETEVRVSLDSNPSGADVYLHFDGRIFYGTKGRHLGPTPLQVSLPRFEGDFAFRVDHRRYHEQDLRIPGTKDVEQVIILEKVRKGQRRKRATVSSAPAKVEESGAGSGSGEPAKTEVVDSDSVLVPSFGRKKKKDSEK